MSQWMYKGNSLHDFDCHSESQEHLVDSRTPRLLKKELGQYNTPTDAAKIIVSWAIRRSDERILEPSFGACGFLEAAANQLNLLGSDEPTRNLFGCDVDKDVFAEYLTPKLRPNQVSHFLHRDFLSTEPADFDGELFDVVVGNPPYVSYHNMPATVRRVAERSIDRLGVELRPKASLWAYFLLHATSFLRMGGRMAWILPSSFLFADYSDQIKRHIASSFERTIIVQLGQRLFLSEGTEEMSAILLAENKRPEDIEMNQVEFEYADTLSGLGLVIDSLQRRQGIPVPLNGRFTATLMSEETSRSMKALEAAVQVVSLGEVAHVGIGIVTGANEFFIVDQVTADRNNLPQTCLRPILSKFSMAAGLALTCNDLNMARFENRKCLLVDTAHPDLELRGSALRTYLASMPRLQRRTVKTFKKRELWHHPDDGRIPDAFFPYMYHHGPHIILNEAQTTSTNTIHRVYFKDLLENRGVTNDIWHKVCAISILSTYSQLSGEQEGRSYGAGVLKHEPSEACRIRLVLPHGLDEHEIETTFRNIDTALRNRRHDEARRCADDFVFGSIPVEERHQLTGSLRQALDEARSRRRRS